MLQFTAPRNPVDSAEREYRRHAPHLWPWAGWHAVVVGGRFVGVFATVADAVTAATRTPGTVDVLVRRIGPRTAIPTPSADGGPAGARAGHA